MLLPLPLAPLHCAAARWTSTSNVPCHPFRLSDSPQRDKEVTFGKAVRYPSTRVWLDRRIG